MIPERHDAIGSFAAVVEEQLTRIEEELAEQPTETEKAALQRARIELLQAMSAAFSVTE